MCLLPGVFTYSTYATDGPPPGVIFGFLLIAPLVFMGVQLPLWALRTWLRWEVSKVDQPVGGSYLQRTRIMDFVWGVAAVSVVLSVARLGTHRLPGEGQPVMILAAFTLVSCVAGVASLGTLPPLVFFVLGTRRVVVGLFGVAIWYTVIASILATLATIAGLSSGAWTAYLLFTGSFTGIMVTVLFWSRAEGFRLNWRRSRQKNEVSV